MKYERQTKSDKVTSASTINVDFEMVPGPDLKLSETRLDFGLDSSKKSFIISNTGNGKLQYSLTATQDWITFIPGVGEVTTDADTIKVTINRNGLSENKHKESIRIVWYIGEDMQENKVDVLVNGVMDQDGNYYGTVRIGAQTWIAENLNTGKQISLHSNPTSNLEGMEPDD
jgi:hypothetical protein